MTVGAGGDFSLPIFRSFGARGKLTASRFFYFLGIGYNTGSGFQRLFCAFIRQPRIAFRYHLPADTKLIDLELASLIARIFIGAGQIGIVYYVVSRMVQAGESRAQAAEQQERKNVRRHTETMTALREFIAQTGGSGTA